MNQILKRLLLIPFFIIIASFGIAYGQQDRSQDQSGDVLEQTDHDKDDHGDEDEHDHEEGEEEEEGISISDSQASLANIEVEVLRPRLMDFQVYAPGDVKANGYTSYHVSPRVESLVLQRHVALGDHVVKGQPLVSLFSDEVADAQAAFRVANSELQRVTQLGREVVGERRFIEAQTDYEAAYGRLLAFGLSEDSIQSLTMGRQPLGEYTIMAAANGSVLSDDFQQGQWVGSGDALIELADESELWVEARLSPSAHLELLPGDSAIVEVDGRSYPATVAQEAHTIDPRTRTRVVRLSVKNEDDSLHPGLFADVYFVFSTEEPVLAVPESALMRGSDGDWTVFVEFEPGIFIAQEVELGRSFGAWREIEGIASSQRVVMEGAFFVASQIAKGGFDPHNH
ncbi:MAG: efflux transporter periplasmic adaptor subunit [Blastopirellula sp.]|nr:MAG: efflux transporter periplasmic adaptor subunit [Blastopirellula sp.]